MADLLETNELDAVRDHLTNIYTWLREPDSVEEASIEWLMDWMNRRPIAAVAMCAMLLPSAALSNSGAK